ncbi:TPA: hypothetical protein ACGQ50_000877 [Enterobacter cloacae]
MQSKYHVLDFDNLNEKGLQPLMRAIKSSGGDVVKIEPAGPARKKDGVATKTFRLINVDGQVLELQVNDSGDLSGAKLNGRNYPAGSPATLRDMAQKIATGFASNAATYANSMAKKLARAAVAEGKKSERKGVKSNSQRLAESKSRVATLQGNVDQLNTTLAQQQKVRDDTNKTIEGYTQNLRSEQAKQRQLKQEIAALEKQIDEYA